MGRISIKNLLFVLLGVLGLMIFLKNNCYDYASDNSSNEVLAQGTVDSIKCHMNREVAKNIGIKPSLKSFSCKFDGKEVFVPFSFIQNYYEARGSVLQNGDDKEFDISQSYSKVYSPKSKYNPRGQFMHFKSFNVEARGRVKCVSAATGMIENEILCEIILMFQVCPFPRSGRLQDIIIQLK